MAYQPNPFVNPNQRGVELPLGCKDLNEVLEKFWARKRTAQPILPVERGSLKDLPRLVERVYGEAYGWSLVIRILGRGPVLVLWVHNRHGGSALTFPLRQRDGVLAQMIPDLFGKVGVPEEGKDGVKMISVPLPHLWLEAAQIVELVIRGYGVSDLGELAFQFRWME